MLARTWMKQRLGNLPRCRHSPTADARMWALTHDLLLQLGRDNLPAPALVGVMYDWSQYQPIKNVLSAFVQLRVASRGSFFFLNAIAGKYCGRLRRQCCAGHPVIDQQEGACHRVNAFARCGLHRQCGDCRCWRRTRDLWVTHDASNRKQALELSIKSKHPQLWPQGLFGFM
jgi:hypothetical protein